MAKLFLSNNKQIIKQIEGKNVKAGFNNYNDLFKPNLNVVSFKKLNIDNQNFIDCGNDDFVATAGTIIYKERIGKQALKNMYSDFDGNIQNLRENIIGNYLLCIKKNNSIYIFCEENNLFNVFYGQNEGKWVVGNSLYDIADNYFGDLTINEFNLIESTFQAAIIGDGTIYNEIRKLQGDEYLYIDLTKNKIKVLEQEFLKLNMNYANDDLVVEQLSEELKTTVGVIGKVFNSHTISMTGGLDARMIFASMLANGIKPNLVYGVGDTPLTNTKDRDLEINKIYADRYNLNFHKMNWETPKPYDKYWDKYMKKYGFLSLIYNASDNVFNEFENIKSDFIDFGYFGETFRNVPWVENLNKKSFNIDEFIDEFYINKALCNMLDKSKFHIYRVNLRNKFIKICNKNKIDFSSISINNFQLIHNEYRKSADAKIVNFMNLHNYSISILSQKKILDFSHVSISLKKDARFMLQVLENIYPDVLEVPFFSHCEDWVFDKDNFRLIKKNAEKDRFSNFKKELKEIIKNKTVIRALQKIKFILNKHKLTTKDLNELKAREELEMMLIAKINNNNFNIIEANNFDGYLPRLAHYSQVLEIIDKIYKS